jgi:hypothetical protein
MEAKLTGLTHKIAIQLQRAVTLAVLAPGGQSGNFWILPRTFLILECKMGLWYPHVHMKEKSEHAAGGISTKSQIPVRDYAPDHGSHITTHTHTHTHRERGNAAVRVAYNEETLCTVAYVDTASSYVTWNVHGVEKALTTNRVSNPTLISLHNSGCSRWRMKVLVFCVIAPCGSVFENQRFGVRAASIFRVEFRHHGETLCVGNNTVDTPALQQTQPPTEWVPGGS